MSRQIAIQGLATQVANAHSSPHAGSAIVQALVGHLECDPTASAIVGTLRMGATLYDHRTQLEVFRDIGIWDGERKQQYRPRKRSRFYPGELMQVPELRWHLELPQGPEDSLTELRQLQLWRKRSLVRLRKPLVRRYAMDFLAGPVNGRHPYLSNLIPLPNPKVGQSAPRDYASPPLDPRQCKPRRHLLGRPSIEPAARFHTSLPTQFRLTLQARVQKTTSDPLNRFLAYLWAYAFTQDGAVLPVMARKLHAFRVGKHWFDVHVPARSNSELVALPTWP